MKISELIKELEETKSKHGDVAVAFWHDNLGRYEEATDIELHTENQNASELRGQPFIVVN